MKQSVRFTDDDVIRQQDDDDEHQFRLDDDEDDDDEGDYHLMERVVVDTVDDDGREVQRSQTYLMLNVTDIIDRLTSRHEEDVVDHDEDDDSAVSTHCNVNPEDDLMMEDEEDEDLTFITYLGDDVPFLPAYYDDINDDDR
jgi:HIV Tat-specific factor 1